MGERGKKYEGNISGNGKRTTWVSKRGRKRTKEGRKRRTRLERREAVIFAENCCVGGE